MSWLGLFCYAAFVWKEVGEALDAQHLLGVLLGLEAFNTENMLIDPVLLSPFR